MSGSDFWYVDSGCTRHMAKDCMLFNNLDVNCKTKVKLDNGQLWKLKEKAQYQFKLSEFMQKSRDVLVDKSIFRNLDKNQVEERSS